MTPTIDSKGLLSIWEDYWEKLSPDWAVTFLNDPRIQLILNFPDSWIHIAVQKHRKLDQILNYLVEAEEERPKPKQARIVSDIDKDPNIDKLIRSIQLERLNDPKIPDHDWWREN